MPYEPLFFIQKKIFVLYIDWDNDNCNMILKKIVLILV